MKKIHIFKFKLNKQELKKAFKPKQMFITVVAVMLLHELVLPLFFFFPDGWKLVLSIIGGVYLAEFFD